MTEGWSGERIMQQERERVPRRTEDDDAKSATLTTERTDGRTLPEREREGGNGMMKIFLVGRVARCFLG